MRECDSVRAKGHTDAGSDILWYACDGNGREIIGLRWPADDDQFIATVDGKAYAFDRHDHGARADIYLECER